MKKISIIFCKIILICIIVILVSNNVSHAGVIGNIFNSAQNFIQEGEQQTLIDNASQKEIVDTIYTVLFYIGVAVTVIWGGVLGIKFMMASAEDKAKLKESLMPYVIGCIIIYGTFGISRLCIQIVSGI